MKKGPKAEPSGTVARMEDRPKAEPSGTVAGMKNGGGNGGGDYELEMDWE